MCVVKVIDTHTHFYDPERKQGVKWPLSTDRKLFRTVLPKDYPKLQGTHPVTGVVVIETSDRLSDNEWALDLASTDPFIVGFVGNLPLGTKNFSPLLEHFAANPKLCGLRLSSARLNSVIPRVDFASDLRLLASYGLTLEAYGGPTMLPRITILADRHPELRIIIDHLARVPASPEPRNGDWETNLRELATRPNVHCKVSALVEATGRRDGTAPGDVDWYRPVLDIAWEIFGEDRIMYGSNWPVSSLFAPLNVVQGIVTDYAMSFGVDAATKVLQTNALALYGSRFGSA